LEHRSGVAISFSSASASGSGGLTLAALIGARFGVSANGRL
jgi:hypothetical protein